MFKKLLAYTGASLLAAVCALAITGSAAASVITPTDASPAVYATGGEVYVASTGLGATTTNLAFSHDYEFDVQSAFNITSLVDALNEPPLGNFGITNLTFTWMGVGPSLTITDGTGTLINVASLPTSFSTGVLAIGMYTLRVTGTTLSAGGNYSLITTVPLPAAALLFGSVLLGGGLLRRRKMIKEFGLPA